MEFSPISSQALPPGTRIEEFVIERVLGSGGFGITYLARDVRLDRQVVIKENLPVQFCFRDTHSLTVAPRHTTGEDAENFRWSLENFSKEAAMLASLDHPGIVKVLRSFEAFGTAYFVMPFVEGVTLDELLVSRRAKGREFSEDELQGMLERMLDALAHLHDRGIYHRDIKPGNILMTTDGNPVLIDFGSARQRLSERSMTVVESAGYTPFEQLQSRGDVGPWSDLYALGATVVKVITGEAPPKANDRAFGDPWQPTSGRVELTGRFSKGFLAGLDRALRLPVEERWQDARAWQQDFVVGKVTSVPGEVPVDVIPLTALGAKSNPSGRRWFVAVCVIFGIGTWLAMRGRNEAPQSDGVDAVVLLGGLVVNSDPSGAEVKNAAGEALGVTPAELKGLKGGLPWLGRLELSGYESAEVKADVVAGESNLVQPVKLKPSPQKVSVTSEPAGADVWKDGILVGTTPYVWENGIPGASTSYVLKKEGYEDGNVEGTVEIGKALDLKVALKRKPVLAGGSETEAVELHRKAANNGDSEGMWKFGLCYEEGREVNQNVDIAYYWYHKSAAAGNPEGMFLLGLCYEFGVGTIENKKEALAWYQKASNLGHEIARERITGSFPLAASNPDLIDHQSYLEYLRKLRDDEFQKESLESR
jgi:hypothetical protein